jgi:hypothetical protein
MCEDSRAERRYWMRRVDELRKQMEREELERQPVKEAPAGSGSGGARPEPLPA